MPNSTTEDRHPKKFLITAVSTYDTVIINDNLPRPRPEYPIPGNY